MKKTIQLEYLERRNLCSGDALTLDVGATKKYLDQLDLAPPAIAAPPDPQTIKLPSNPTVPLTEPIPDPSDSRLTILLDVEPAITFPLMPIYYDIATGEMIEDLVNDNPYD